MSQPLSLNIGQSVAVQYTKLVQPTSQWCIPPGVYSARQITNGAIPLLHSILSTLGGNSNSVLDREILINGLRSLLSTDTRESTLPSKDKEIADQAHRVSETLIRWVEDAPQINEHLTIRSPCEGHLWTPDVVGLLFGPRSNNQLMQLYNEWLHQMILLRDALLPFENFEEVPLILRNGIRDFEQLRNSLILQCLQRVSQSTIIDAAKIFTAPDLPKGGYAFQYAHGLVLPSVTGRLLRYYPFRLDNSDRIFDYEFKDYFSAPRTTIGEPYAILAPGDFPSSEGSGTTPTLTPHGSTLALDLHGSKVDFGQIARGSRYAYHAEDSPTGLSRPASLHLPAAVLALPGLVTAEDGVHVIPVHDPAVKLALLGKLYPENVIIASHETLGGAEKVGKGFGPRFIIFQQ